MVGFYYYYFHPTIAKKEKENAIINTGLPNLKHKWVQNDLISVF